MHCHINAVLGTVTTFITNWEDHENGFGCDLDGELWIGLKNIHKFTGCGAPDIYLSICISLAYQRTNKVQYKQLQHMLRLLHVTTTIILSCVKKFSELT